MHTYRLGSSLTELKRKEESLSKAMLVSSVYCILRMKNVLFSGITSVKRAVDNATTSVEGCITTVSEFTATTFTCSTLPDYRHQVC